MPSERRPRDSGRDLLSILLLALGMRLIFAAIVANTYDYDEFVLLLLSRDFAHGAIPYHNFAFFHPPGALLILRALDPVISWWWPSARLFTMLVDTAAAGLVWYIGRRLGGSRVGLISGAVYAVNPLTLVAAVRVGQEPLLTALGVLGLALLVSDSDRGGRFKALLAGVCLGAAIMIKLPAALFVPVYVLASPRRTPLFLAGATAAIALVLAPFLGYSHQMYDQVITFQRTRWLMPFDQRLETVALWWLVVNPLALWAIVRVRPPWWLSVGFCTGIVYASTSQVFYHYFVPVVPFAAVLSGLFLARVPATRMRSLLAGGLAACVVWGIVLVRGGSSPLYVTAAHLSDVRPVIQVLEKNTGSRGPVLADRDEYAFLADRPAFDHYFWNVGVLVNAKQLEHGLPRAKAVVLSIGASSGFPDGFVTYLNAHHLKIKHFATATVWIP